MGEVGDSAPPGEARGFDGPELRSLQVDPAWVDLRIRELRRSRSEGGPASRKEMAALIPLLDLTTLRGGDTRQSVRTLCGVARSPLPRQTLAEVGGPERTPAAVCVHQAFISTAREALDGSEVRVATVAAGFPHALSSRRTRILDVEEAVAAGADEVDVVFPRFLALEERWEELYADLVALRTAAGTKTVKVILATGELGGFTGIARASRVALQAGADFIKTSTGMESVNATVEAGLIMAREIRSFHERTGVRAGLKPAGGIGDPEVALLWLHLVREELGEEWLNPEHFRFGASSLLETLAGRLTPG